MSGQSPGKQSLVPRYHAIEELIRREVADFSDDQLDWQSEQWGWSKWSIRRNLSHIANTLFKTIMLQMRDQIWPAGDAPHIPDLQHIVPSPGARHLDEMTFHEAEDILRVVGEGIALVQSLLERETDESLRLKKISGPAGPYLPMLAETGTAGIKLLPGDPQTVELTLAGVILTIYYEAITHLYNIQRLKRAQGLTATSSLPQEGFWVLPGWDRSEPG